MKLTKKILIISLIALSYFLIKPSDASARQADIKISDASENGSTYHDETYNERIKLHSINIIRTI